MNTPPTDTVWEEWPIRIYQPHPFPTQGNWTYARYYRRVIGWVAVGYWHTWRKNGGDAE